MLKILLNRIKLSSERRKLYLLLRSVLGFYPRKLEIYELSIIHKSSVRKKSNGQIINNERLEFLGDAILGAVVAEELYSKYPQLNEGLLTKNRSKIVNRVFLNETAQKIGLNKIIVLQNKIDLEKTNIPGDALEALIGAIFEDYGYKKCRKFILKKILSPYVDFNKIVNQDNNYKSALIEWGQKHKRSIQFITKEIPGTLEHAPIFVSTVEIESIEFGQGEGASKKESQQNAAMKAMQNEVIRKQIVS